MTNSRPALRQFGKGPSVGLKKKGAKLSDGEISGILDQPALTIGKFALALFDRAKEGSCHTQDALSLRILHSRQAKA